MSQIGVTIDGKEYKVELELHQVNDPQFTAKVNGELVEVNLPESNSKALEWISINNRLYEVSMGSDLKWFKSKYGIHNIEARDLESTVSRPSSRDGRVKAPVPGKIAKILVSINDTVDVGTPLLILEAMKMENIIRSPRAGKVKEIQVEVGKNVFLNQVLVEVE
ncbi:MAG: biotin attachment protein [Leptospiraceae bacterium]|nr:hypothetical protein [Leptospiraceae bacterium]MCP5494351.1 biotin attachment protein [Leptospiraceae bacterium]